MSFDERLRESVYWLLDAVKGGNIKRHYKEVMAYYENGISDEDVKERLDKLFAHVLDTCEFYANLKGKEKLTLQDFPIMNKLKYIEHFSEVESSAYKNAKGNVTMKTSGSTGIPFAIIQNKDKVDRNTAVSIVLNEKGGYRLGDKMAHSRVWVKNSNKRSKLRQIMENMIPIEALVLDDAWCEKMYHAIVKKHVKSITMYPAGLGVFANYLEEKKPDLSGCRLQGIFTISEAPNEVDKERISKLLHCPVNAFYSSQENGNMSLQDETGDYHFDTSTWYVEILKFDSDEPAQEGEVGRIVITDLYNYAFPMIRYDNGDVGCYYKKKVEGTNCYKTYLSNVFGRRVDMVYDINGNPLSFNFLTIKMRGIPNLVQWQFIQLDKDKYQFLLNCNGEVDTGIIVERFKDICGENISFEYVSEIPVMASGKRKLVENRMNQSKK